MAVQPSLVSHVREDYQKSTTYHDGKWLFATVDSVKVLKDVKRLPELKRRPKAAENVEPSPLRRKEQRNAKS